MRSGYGRLACLIVFSLAAVTLRSGSVEASRKVVVNQRETTTFAGRPGPTAINGPKDRTRSQSSLSTALSKGSSYASHREKALSVRGGVVANTVANGILGSVAMGLIEQAVKKALAAAGVQFPAQLGGCIFLFVTLLFLEVVSPTLANGIFDALSPGAALLAKWLPVFFVPGLVMLPLAPPVGNSVEILKVLVVVGLGFIYSLCTTTFAVIGVRTAQGSMSPPKAGPISAKQKKAGPVAPRPYSEECVSMLFKGTVLLGLASVVAKRTENAFATPIQSAFLLFATVWSYVWGARLPPAFVKMVHPLVTSSLFVLALAHVVAPATGSTFLDVLRTYKSGSLSPMKAGPADILLFLLGPSVVSFAISMYSRRALLRQNLLPVLSAMLVASAGGLFGTAAFVRAIALGGAAEGKVVRLSVLARNVTTALSMALTAMIGGDISLAAIAVVLTGITGATYGKSLLTFLGVTDPICRGLGIGSSSQGLGVAAIADELDAFPFAAIAMVLNAISATTLASIPAIKNKLIQIAAGP